MTASVAILTRDAGPAFAATLAAIAGQVPPPAELVILDSGSTDGTVERARAAGALVRTIAGDRFDFGRARDHLFALTTSALVATLSQDVVPRDGTWLARLTAPFDDPRVALVSARCAAHDPESMFLWQRMGRFYFTREMRRFAARWGTPCSYANGCVRRAVWARLGHGPMPIAEDLLLQQKVRRAGLEVRQVDEPIAWHQHAYDLASAWRRAFAEGRAMARLGIDYRPGDALGDALGPSTWLALARQLRYRRVRRPVDLLYPLLRPAAVWSGRRRDRDRRPGGRR